MIVPSSPKHRSPDYYGSVLWDGTGGGLVSQIS